MRHGWDYMAAITRGIEAWSGDMVRADPTAFAYRGADLRYAVERSLFFQIVNDAALQARFDAFCAEGTPNTLRTDTWAQVIAPYLFDNGNTSPGLAPRVTWRKKLRKMAGNLSRIGHVPYRTAGLKGHPEILLLVIDPKFVRFFASVRNLLQMRTAFLTVKDPALERYLDQNELPYVALSNIFSHAPRGSGLNHFSDLCSSFDCMAVMQDILKPSVIAVPEGNAPVYEVALRAGRQRGISTVCVQHGAPAYTNPGFRNWTFTDVLVWGEAFRESYTRYNPGQHISVTGTAAIFPKPRDGASDTAVRSIGFFLQKGATVIPEEEWADLLHFIAWTAQTFPNVEIIVRDHPTQPHLTESERASLGRGANIRFMPPPDFSLSDALAASDVVVAAASTTLLEAIQVGAIPFIFGTAYPKDFPDIVGAGAGVIGSSQDKAKDALTFLMANGAHCSPLRKGGSKLRPYLFAAGGQEGAARIAGALRAAIT